MLVTMLNSDCKLGLECPLLKKRSKTNNTIKITTLFLVSIVLGACKHTPVAFDQNQLFIGAFKSKQETDKVCSYSEIEGIGLKLGWPIFGIGYFNRKIIVVHSQEDGQCENEFVTVYVDKCEKGNCRIIDKSMEGN